MTRTEFDKIIPHISVVIFANSDYLVASKELKFGVPFVEIFDEPPSRHTDWIKAESLILNPYKNPTELKRVDLSESEKGIAALLEKVALMQSGFGGVDRNGNVVDRRDNKDAIPFAENRLFDTPKLSNV